jgi:hypothetical protein
MHGRNGTRRSARVGPGLRRGSCLDGIHANFIGRNSWHERQDISSSIRSKSRAAHDMARGDELHATAQFRRADEVGPKMPVTDRSRPRL